MIQDLVSAAVRGRSGSSPAIFPVACGRHLYALETHTLALYRVTPSVLRAMLTAPASAIDSAPEPIHPAPDQNQWPCCASLILNLTHACNLRCAYCFVREQAKRHACRQADYMTPALARRAVDEFYPADADRKPGTIRVGFFGGEPLLAWQVLRETVEYCEARDPEARFSCTTNGTLMDQEKADFFAERKGRFSFIVSLDGNKARHNALRPLAHQGDGQDSQARTMAGLELLAGAGFRPTLRSTFTADGCDLAAELEWLNGLCDRGLAGHVSVEPVSLTEGCVYGQYAITPERMRAMTPMYMDAANWFAARAAAGQRARYHHLTKTLERLIHKTPQCTECGAGRAYLTVSPNGDVHACHREKSLIGRFGPDGLVWLPTRERWRDNRLEAHQRCPSCPVRYLCGGGCRLDAQDEHDDTRKPDEAGCMHAFIRLRMAVHVLDAIGPAAAARACGIPLVRRMGAA